MAGVDEGRGSYGRMARFYDAIYDANGKDYRAEAASLADLAAELGAGRGSLLDVACGTGRHLEGWIDRFDSLAGADASLAMLDIARERLPERVALEVADFAELDLGRRFDVVTCLFSSIGHVADEVALDRVIARLAAHVAPGRVLLIEPWLQPDQVVEGGLRHVETAETDDGVVARASSSWRDDDALVVRFAWAVATTGGVEALEESHRLRLFTRQRYLDAVAAAGLEPSWLETDVAARPTAGSPSWTAGGTGRGLLVGRSVGATGRR